MTNRKTESSSVLGASDNQAVYQHSFLQRAHCLLQCAYQNLASRDFCNAQEDVITGELCKHMSFLTEDQPSAGWMRHFSVHDQYPVHDIPAAEGSIRTGKRRPKVDIRLVQKTRVPNIGMAIEAKRICRSDSVSKYIGDDGIGAFVCGEYGRTESFGSMLAYVQSHSIAHWLPKVSAKLDKANAWQAQCWADGPSTGFQSTHSRHSGDSITLFHSFFDFAK